MVLHITPDDSVIQSSTPAFDDSSTTDRTIVVDAGAFLIGLQLTSDGMYFGRAGNLALTINGTVFGDSSAVALNGGGLSVIRIGVEGDLGGLRGVFDLADAVQKVTNLGVIGGTLYALRLSGGADQFTNGGTVNGDVDMGADNDTVTNFARVGTKVLHGAIHGAVDLGAGNDRLTNGGTVSGVDAGAGADVVTNFVKVGKKTYHGIISGTVDLGIGNDKFFGGNHAETVKDGDGSDLIKLGGGNDAYIATGATTDGTDTIDGGAGAHDLYDPSASTGALSINLDTVAHTGTVNFTDSVGKSTAFSVSVSPSFGTDRITGFEDANGGSGQDLIFGSKAANTLDGGGREDDLYGLDGNDTLIGGDADDNLVGGRGADTELGGTGADTFWFLALSDTGLTRATRDRIIDFSGVDHDGDLINLSKIDAIKGGADNPFDFIGTNVKFGHHAGELRAYWTSEGQVVAGDVNGDGKADFSIFLPDPDHAITLAAGDFVL